jgi:hypothetical protein
VISYIGFSLLKHENTLLKQFDELFQRSSFFTEIHLEAEGTTGAIVNQRSNEPDEKLL